VYKYNITVKLITQMYVTADPILLMPSYIVYTVLEYTIKPINTCLVLLYD